MTSLDAMIEHWCQCTGADPASARADVLDDIAATITTSPLRTATWLRPDEIIDSLARQVCQSQPERNLTPTQHIGQA